jgi:hypothetical protein
MFDSSEYSALGSGGKNRSRFGSHIQNYTNNLNVLGIAFFLIFAAWNTTQSFATTVDPSLGNAFLFTLYLTFTFFAVLGPRIVHYLGPKNAIIVGAFPYLFGVLSFLAPADMTIENQYILKIVVGVFVGFGAPIMWTGQGVYLARIASRHAENLEEPNHMPQLDVLIDSNRSNEASNAALAEFNGVFFSFFQANGFVGSVGTGLVFLLATGDLSKSYPVVFTALSITCCLGILVAIFALPRVDAMENEGVIDRNNIGGKSKTDNVSIIETLKLLCAERKMYLMVPIILYNGFTLGFIFGTMPILGWEKAYGKRFGPFGTGWFYIINTIATYVIGRFAKTPKKQKKVMLLAGVLHILVFASIIFLPISSVECKINGCGVNTEPKGDELAKSCFYNEYDKDDHTFFPTKKCTPTIHSGNETRHGDCVKCEPYTDVSQCPCKLLDTKTGNCKDPYTQCDWLRGTAETPSLFDAMYLFVLVLLFAIGDAVWESQIPAYLQSIFSESDNDTNAAMSNLKMWQSLGFALQFALGIKGMPLYGKDIEYSVYICSGLLLFGLLCLSFVLADDRRSGNGN